MSEKNDALVVLNESCALLDSELRSIKLSIDNFIVTCELIFNPRVNTLSVPLIVRLVGVKKFDFFYDGSNEFYLVDRYKLIQRESGEVYLSLDPYDESDVESKDDRGVLISEKICII